MLKSVVSHVGERAGNGHYICHCRRGESTKWQEFDDSRVRELEYLPTSLQTCAYLLFYVRQDDVEPKTEPEVKTEDKTEVKTELQVDPLAPSRLAP